MTIKKEETQIERKEEEQFRDSIYRLGYWNGRLDELKEYTPFVSANWWMTFFIGIIWGIVIASWIGVLK